MQKAIIIELDSEKMNFAPHKILNDYLNQGWSVINLAPFGSATSSGGYTDKHQFVAAILVIIEKKD